MAPQRSGTAEATLTAASSQAKEEQFSWL